MFLLLLPLALTGCGELMENNEPHSTSCYACSLYSFVFKFIGEVSAKFFEKARELSLDLLSLGLLFYIASFAYKLFAGFLGQENKEIIKMKDALFKTIFKVIIVAILLSSHEMFLSLFEYIVVPVIQAFIGVAKIILEGDPNIDLSQLNYDPTNGSGDAGVKIFTDDIGQPIETLIFYVYKTLVKGMEFGTRAIFSGDVSKTLSGIFLWGVFWWMSIYVPFIFIDSFFKLGFIVIVSPLVLVCVPFQATKKAVKAAWDILFGSMIQLLLGCIYISLMITILQTNLVENPINSNSAADMTKFGQVTLIDPGNMANATPLEVVLLIYCLTKVMKKIPVLAKYFGGDESSGSFNQVGKIFKSGLATGMGAAVGPGGIGRGLLNGMKDVAGSFGSMVSGGE